jgi:hypothetical protein
MKQLAIIDTESGLSSPLSHDEILIILGSLEAQELHFYNTNEATAAKAHGDLFAKIDKEIR